MKEIQRISVTDAVVNSIREMIESGQYEVGHKLPAEAAFCEQMKVSRTCVREALRVLQTLQLTEGSSSHYCDIHAPVEFLVACFLHGSAMVQPIQAVIPAGQISIQRHAAIKIYAHSPLPFPLMTGAASCETSGLNQ